MQTSGDVFAFDVIIVLHFEVLKGSHQINLAIYTIPIQYCFPILRILLIPRNHTLTDSALDIVNGM